MKRSGPLRRKTPLRARSARREPGDHNVPESVRVEVHLRSRGRCEGGRFSPGCTGFGVHLHHVLRRSQGGRHTAENLRYLCVHCHAAVHHEPARARSAGLLASAYSKEEPHE